MNVTVADPAGHSYRFPVQFFSHLNLIRNALLLMYMDMLAITNMRASFSHVSHAVYIFP